MTVAGDTLRLNLGSGKFPLEGWTNVDAYCEADVQLDFFDCDFPRAEEIRMSHVLEHVSWRQTVPLLKRVLSWLADEGTLTVEVPDMAAILALGTRHPLWFKYVYGDQSHEGEYHLAGFTAEELARALRQGGFRVLTVRRFVSTHPGRDGMPCLEAVASV